MTKTEMSSPRRPRKADLETMNQPLRPDVAYDPIRAALWREDSLSNLRYALRFTKRPSRRPAEEGKPNG